ncbi:MAG: hypothetical protein H0W66_11055 [Chthoniobacterales bacterium]|nr:hypothetical protein [Chthoniobacterales bacterium]
MVPEFGPQTFLAIFKLHDHNGTMIDISALKTSRLENTPVGAIFLPAGEGRTHFLCGRLNDFTVLIELDGEKPFWDDAIDLWSRASGLIVEGARVQVDHKSALPIDSVLDAPVGSVILGRDGPMLRSRNQNGSHAVLLVAGEGETVTGRGDVAFTSWRFVTGQGDALVVLFESEPPIAGVRIPAEG